MATNVVLLNVYQIDNRVMDAGAPKAVAFPVQGNILLWDTINSPTRSLPSGVDVYSMVQVTAPAAANSQGTSFYVAETIAQLVALFNA